MSDISAPTTDEVDDLAPKYPDGPVGSLMRQRDEASASAEAARGMVQQYQAAADARDGEVDALSRAIDALGGEAK